MDESDKVDEDEDEDDEDEDDNRSDSKEDLVLSDLDEPAESGDSEIQENEDQFIPRSGRLATTRQSRFL